MSNVKPERVIARAGRGGRRALAWAAIVAGMGLTGGQTALGQSNIWLTAGGGAWNTGGNWSLGVPTGAHDVTNALTGAPVSLTTAGTFRTLSFASNLTLSAGGSLGGSLGAGGSSVSFTGGAVLAVNGGRLVNLAVVGGTVSFGASTSNNMESAVIGSAASITEGGFVELRGGNTLSGTWMLASEFAAENIRLQNVFTNWTIAPAGQLRGYGVVSRGAGSDTLTNNGLISADTAGKTLVIGATNLGGSGTVSATGGGVVRLSTRFNGAGAAVLPDAASTVVVSGGTLTGSFAAANGSGFTFDSSTANVIENATVLGNLTLPAGSFVEARGTSLVDAGTIAMSGGTGPGGSVLRLQNVFTRLTIGTAATLRGSGTVARNAGSETLANEGLVSADVSGQTLRLDPTNLTGSGTYTATNGATLSIGSNWTGTNATVAPAAGGTVLVDGGRVLGSFAASTGTGITFSPSTANAIENADIGGNVTIPSLGFVEARGTSVVRGVGAISGGTLRLQNVFTRLTFAAGGQLQGFGTVSRNAGSDTLVNEGLFSADVSGQTLRIDATNLTGSGTYTASTGATLSIGSSWAGTNATVAPAAGGTVLVDGGRVLGSFAASTGSGITFSSNPFNAVENADIGGNVTIPALAFVEARGTSVVRGVGSISGGTLRLQNVFTSLTFAPGAELQGFGTVSRSAGSDTLVNAGLFSADAAGQTLRIDATNLTGSGTFTAALGATLSVGSSWTGTNATVAPAAGGTVLVDGGRVLGSFVASTGSGITFSSNTANAIENADIGGNVTIPSGAFVEARGTSVIRGVIAMGGGTLRLQNVFTGLRVADTGEMRGYGSVLPNAGSDTLRFDGKAVADSAGNELLIRATTTRVGPTGELRAEAGGKLVIDTTIVGEAGAGVTTTGPGSEVILRAGSLTGVLGGTGTVTVAADPLNVIENADLSHNLDLGTAGFVEARGTTVLRGTTRLRGASAEMRLQNVFTGVTVEAGAVLGGEGRVTRNAGSDTLTNRGLVSADVPGGTLFVGVTNFRNDATVRVVAGATMQLATNYNQPGGIAVPSLLQADGSVVYTGGLSIAGGTVAGDGSLSGNLILTGAALAPGNAAGDATGSLAIGGTLSMTSASRLAVEISGNAQGNTYDLVTVAGNGTLAGTLSVNFAGFTPNVGDTFDVLTRAGGSGIFTTLVSVNPLVGYFASYTAAGGSPNDRVRITVTNVIPEPGAMAILVVPVAAMSRRRRR